MNHHAMQINNRNHNQPAAAFIVNDGSNPALHSVCSTCRQNKVQHVFQPTNKEQDTPFARQ
jgi:hypothetical protein